MKAAVNETYGDPSVIKITDIPKPNFGPDEILIKIAYSTVNRTDEGFLRANPFVTRLFTGLLKPKYPTLGCEFSGVIESVGYNVIDFSVGDRVFGFDDARFGSYAEYKTIRADKMITKVPDGIPLEIAAAATEGSHYALFYIYKINPATHPKVFVNGATGAIGSAAVQLLKAKGFYVCASSTTSHLTKIKELGADHVVDWQETNIYDTDEVFDVFFDAVGKSAFAQARSILNIGGVYMSSELGQYGQNPLLALANPIQKLFTKHNIYFPIPQTRKKEINYIAESLENGAFSPLIDRTYELDEIIEAFKYVETGHKNGSVVIRVS